MALVQTTIHLDKDINLVKENVKINSGCTGAVLHDFEDLNNGNYKLLFENVTFPGYITVFLCKPNFIIDPPTRNVFITPNPSNVANFVNFTAP